MKPLRNPKERKEALERLRLKRLYAMSPSERRKTLEKTFTMEVFCEAMLGAGSVRRALKDNPEFREWYYRERRQRGKKMEA